MTTTELCDVLVEISRTYIKSCKEDILIDLPKMLEMNRKGEDIDLFVRTTGADLAERAYRSMENKDATYNDALEYQKRTLGVDCAIRLHTGTGKVEILPVNGDIETAEHLVCNLKEHIGIADANLAKDAVNA